MREFLTLDYIGVRRRMGAGSMPIIYWHILCVHTAGDRNFFEPKKTEIVFSFLGKNCTGIFQFFLTGNFRKIRSEFIHQLKNISQSISPSRTDFSYRMTARQIFPDRQLRSFHTACVLCVMMAMMVLMTGCVSPQYCAANDISRYDGAGIPDNCNNIPDANPV